MEMKKELYWAVAQAKQGMEEGFNYIYTETYQYVYFRAKSILKQEDEVWDILQEVYLAAYKSIGKLEEPGHLYAWLGGITYNLCMKALRKRKKTTLLSEEDLGIIDDIEADYKDYQPEQQVEDQATAEIVKELIDQLPKLQRAAVMAYYFDELSVAAIAEQFECSTGTIKSRLNYARQFLKQAVEEKEKKMGMKLRAFSIPTLLLAFRLLARESVASAAQAQAAYSSICSGLGIVGTPLKLAGAGSQFLESITDSLGSSAWSSGSMPQPSGGGFDTTQAAGNMSQTSRSGFDMTRTTGDMPQAAGNDFGMTQTAADMPQPIGNGMAQTTGSMAQAVGKGAAVTGEAAKRAGLVGRFLAASTGAKLAIGGTAAAVLICAAVGGASLLNRNTSSGDGASEGKVTVIEELVGESQNSSQPSIIVNPYQPSQEELQNLTPMINGLIDSIPPGYQKGNPLTDQQRMGIAYQMLLSFINYGNKQGYVHSIREYTDRTGNITEGSAYAIPKEDIDLLLTSILDGTVSEHKSYPGLAYEDGTYYLFPGLNGTGFKSYSKDRTIINRNYQSSNMNFEAEGVTIDGLKTLSYSLEDGSTFDVENTYQLVMGVGPETKFGKYTLISFTSDELIEEENDTEEAEEEYAEAYRQMKKYLRDYLINLIKNKYRNYEYSEYFIYDWRENEPPVLITRDAYNENSCTYHDIHYTEGNDSLSENGEGVFGSRNSVIYKSGEDFIIVTDIDDLIENESHSAYLYTKVYGEESEAEQLWSWYRIDGKTFWENVEDYEAKRAEIEQLEAITWYPMNDFSPFEGY